MTFFESDDDLAVKALVVALFVILFLIALTMVTG